MPQLPAIRAPRNALLNFEPLGNAISEVGQINRQKEQQQHARGIQSEQMDMRREEHGLRKKSFEQKNKSQRVKQIAGVMQQIDKISDPARRESLWSAYGKREPELFQSLPEEARDAINGPKFLIAEARGYVDPMKGKLDQANLSRIEAQTAKARREGTAAGATYGRSGMVFNDKDGQQFTVQFGSDGTRKILPVDGMTRERAVKTVDTGTEQLVLDGSTGETKRSIANDIVGEAKLKAEGKRQGEVVANVRKARGTMFSLEQQWNTVDQAIDKALENIGAGTTGFIGSGSSHIPGTPAYDMARTIDTIKSNIGFDKLQDMRNNSPTGGALGQVSEFENRLLQSVRNSLEQGQSGDQLAENLRLVKKDLIALQDERRRAYALDYGPDSGDVAPQEQAAPKKFTYNPDTGQLEPQ